MLLISMLAWVLRFGLFGMGNPQMPGLLLLILSMIVYGIAFDFFNISGSLFVERETDASIRSSAQGVFMLMTNGLGATIGSFCAQSVVNSFTHSASKIVMGEEKFFTIGEWSTCWYIFAGFALVVAVMFATFICDVWFNNFSTAVSRIRSSNCPFNERDCDTHFLTDLTVFH